ncbi:MAG: SMC-Scp complex subunit ScpB [Oscillospiraceae bacterium]|nr:SMC-Scp complex subunit ScpB [Oscillospiraceae bacterium]MBR6561554.1 SMC-Scp complex subunit ScpB [Oscillospiraceae bacterium]
MRGRNTVEYNETLSAIEAILFASGEPVPAERIARVLGLDKETVINGCMQLSDAYSFEQRGIRIVRMEENFQMCSSPDYAQEIGRVLEQRKPPRLTQPSLEVLAIVAYFQPVTRAYIDQVRGVDSSYTVNLLTERGLIEPCGRLEVPGRPTIYQTGDLFLRTMGITTLEELPPLPNLGEDEGLVQLQSAIDRLQAGEGEQLEIGQFS